MKKLVWFLLMPLLFVACSKDDGQDGITFKDCEPALYKMFPTTDNVEWKSDLGYFVAKFDYTPMKAKMEVWFDEKDARWIMSDYNYGARKEVLTSRLLESIAHNREIELVEARKYEHRNGMAVWRVTYQYKSNGRPGTPITTNIEESTMKNIDSETMSKPLTPLSVIWIKSVK